MKGTTWKGDYFATKGCTRSEGSHMFSVGNLVAFEVTTFSSPDGRNYSYGCIPSQDNYLLQEEIVLEEYNRTESNRYGSGSYDIKKIVELKDVFWHERSTQLIYKTFLLQILENDKNVFLNDFIAGDIAEVRNHPGKFLHIYEIPEGYRGCKAESFTETVEKINLQKKQEDDFGAEKVAKRYRGVELIFGITASGWYASRASFGKHSVQLQHEYDTTSRDHYKLVIMPCVLDGSYQFYLGRTPISLYLQDGREPSISIMTDTHWANSQSWRYRKIQTLSIEKGWIFVDGEDVYENTKKTVDELQAAQKLARKNKFDELSKAVTEKYGEEVLKLALRKKGSVLAILKVLSESSVQVELAELKKIFGLSSSAPVIANLMACVAGEVDTFKAAKVAEKAYAWSYLHNALPDVGFMGYFDDAKEALEIYSKNWKKDDSSNGGSNGGNTLGDFFRKSGIIL